MEREDFREFYLDADAAQRASDINQLNRLDRQAAAAFNRMQHAPCGRIDRLYSQYRTWRTKQHMRNCTCQ